MIKIIKYLNLLKKYNKLENAYQVLEQSCEEKVLNKYMDKLCESEINKKLRDENKYLRRKNKLLKNQLLENKR